MAADFGISAADYARARVPFHPALFTALRAREIIRPGILVLDVASGSGLLADGLRDDQCEVIALDRSFSLLSAADSSHRVVATAEQLPFRDHAFDLVTVANAWHWLDRHRTPREIARVLRPGGAVLVVYQTHIPTPGSVAQASEAIILKHRPRWAHANSTGLNGQVLRDLQSAGYSRITSESFDVDLRFSRDEWLACICTLSPVGPSMLPEELVSFQLDLTRAIQTYGAAFDVLHRVFIVHARIDKRAL